MGNRTMTPPEEPSSPTDSSIRKRVGKACDRCRLKKSKCDGSSPCSRCRADNAICVFGERKKSQDKVYPKGYVEMLESQQTQLVAGLQELYRRLQSGEGWTGPALRESSRGTPLTHDILERLGALKPDPKTGVDHFEENYDVLQNILFANGAGPLQREPSFDTSSEAGQSPTCEIVSQSRIPSYSNSFSAMQFPPTPPIGSPHQFPSKSNSSLKVEMPLPNHSPWQADSTEYSEMDYNMTYETALSDAPMQATTFTNQVYNGLDTMSINPCLTMKQWPTTDDQFQRYIHSTFT